MSRAAGAYEQMQESIARHFQKQDEGDPLENRCFLRLIPTRDDFNEKVFQRIGESCMLDAVLVYHMTNTDTPMNIEEVTKSYRNYITNDDDYVWAEGGDEQREIALMLATEWAVYEVLCLLVGVGLGIWAEV